MPAFTMQSPIGLLTIEETDGAITALRFGGETVSPPPTPLLQRAAQQLTEYFAARRRRFDLPLRPQGTVFQQAAWSALCAIPYGQTRTYAQQAAAIGNPKACRAVGMANHCNPLPLFIPCHRVIGAGGKLTGYAGGLAIKRFLLELEQASASE
ncbi:MAG: methylated-DNA--[protein]-cysteine S-methyltransferase [Clostridiales bacterium]|nr:methylated-DNA--[protein]-cysteine S-methyltransferase [Clostridiales bacterium]